MRKLLTASFLTLALVAIIFRTTHHPVYGNCHQTADGQVCQLIKYVSNR